MTYYDDHMYCEACGHHARDCWCYTSGGAEYEVENDDPDNRCPGGPGHGY